MENKTTTAIFVNSRNELLFYLRDNKKTIPYPNYWCTLGGHFDENETPLQALKREIKEEIELEIEDKNLEFLGITYDIRGYKTYIYKSQIDKEINELVLNEGQELKFFGFEKMINLKMPESLRKFVIENKDKIINKN
ncbi:hypothetical protein CMI40_01610 [Candidatus Pacearchaeota archaeon]|jgi:8-oxo-dGTP diphosphatase|nr:hypothetical protein [Candidatus Pacearchaeota archaeon]|tara:strand:+ start:1319 stop:1729 length:411 start_codon:yes stop_codon:yes gene_type:complete